MELPFVLIQSLRGPEVVCRVFHHQDPGSAVLYVLDFLEAPAMNPDEECVTVVQCLV